MVNVSLFPGEPKGTELGEEIAERGTSARGRVSPHQEGPEAGPGQGEPGSARLRLLGPGCVTLGKSLSPQGLRFPDSAKQCCAE